MVITYGYALLNAGMTDTALGLESVYDTFGHLSSFVFLMGSIYMKAGMLEQAVTEFTRATTLPAGSTEGTNSYLAYYNLGVICECIGMIDEAKDYYKKCGSYPKAEDRLHALQVN